MRIRSAIGDVNVSRQKQMKWVGIVTVKITMVNEEGNLFTLERGIYGEEIRRRQDVTARVVWEKVDEMLEGRDDLDGLTLRGVTVVQESDIWSTPHDEMWPKDEEDGS